MKRLCSVAALALLLPGAARADDNAARTPEETRVRVRWETAGSTGAVLYARGTTRYAPDTWRRVCTLPCAEEILAADEYKVGGGARESLPFRLPVGASVAHVDVVSGINKDIALVLLGAGAVATVIGLVVSVATWRSSFWLPPGDHVDNTPSDVGGGVAAGGLFAMAVGGLLALAEHSHRTTVSFVAQERDPDPPEEDTTGGP